jgi:cytidyltransferase-like protein
MSKVTRVYVDGVYDLFHRGHVESLIKAKNIRPNVYLIVGLISDASATDYKRQPIFPDDDRYALLKACKYVDQVIYNSPLIITTEFIRQYEIDLVVHGFSDIRDLEKQQPFFEQIKELFELIPYFPYSSTTKYMEKINSQNTSSGVVQITPTLQHKPPESMMINHFHGGQDIHSTKVPVRVDMSVTTNGLGPLEWNPVLLMDKIDHYPPIHDTELYNEYCKFMKIDTVRANVLFGNGATELIDLLLRNLDKKYSTWRTNDVDVQYSEYENSCNVSGRIKNHTDANLHIIVNPNNPTGDFMNFDAMKNYISNNVKNDSFIIVDESMLFWYGEDWRYHSFTAYNKYIRELKNTRNIQIAVVQSWTKIYACTGLRFGSLMVYDDELYTYLKTIQPPWSVNVFARDYIIRAWNTPGYLNQTWLNTSSWRKEIIRRLEIQYPEWKFYGESFCSFIWIDTCKEIIADRLVNLSKDHGFPIRHGKNGYGRPTFVRIGVRDPSKLEDWFEVIKNLQPGTMINASNVPTDIVISQSHVDINSIKIHENVIIENVIAFESYLEKSQNFLIPSIIISEEMVLIDGHHRLELMKKMGYSNIPVTIINYYHPSVLTHIIKEKQLSKQTIIETALSGKTLPPKSTRHVLQINDKCIPLSMLSINISLELHI